MDNEKRFPKKIVRAYKTRNGKGYLSTLVDGEVYDALQKVKPGDKLLLSIVPEEARKDEKSPQAYFSFYTKEQLDEFKQTMGNKVNFKNTSDDV